MSDETLLVTTVKSGNSFPEALGISDERLKKLHDILAKSLKITETFTGAMSLFSASCENANELAYMCFKVGIIVADTQKVESPEQAALSGLHGLMSALKEIKSEMEKDLKNTENNG